MRSGIIRVADADFPRPENTRRKQESEKMKTLKTPAMVDFGKTLKRRASAGGGSASAAERGGMAAGDARTRFPNAMKSDASTREALARMERIWKDWESEPRVKGCSSALIRRGREERGAAIQSRMGALRPAGRAE